MPRIESKNITPELVRDFMARHSKHKPTFSPDWIGWKGKRAVFLADIPAGEFARVYTKTGRFKDKFETETNIVKILEVKQTRQEGNPMVLVQIDGWVGRTALLAAGTSAFRLSHQTT